MRNLFNLRGTANQSQSTSKRPKSHPISRRLRSLFEKKPIKNLLGYSLIIITFSFNYINPSNVFGEKSDTIETINLSPIAVKLTTNESVRYPLDSEVKINQNFHSWHPGVDLKGNIEDPIYPILKGQVSLVKYQNFAYGNHVIIDHGQGLYSLYAHLNQIYVQLGQTVTIYQPLGQVGTTGHSTGPHLHLEVIDQDHRINPLSFINL